MESKTKSTGKKQSYRERAARLVGLGLSVASELIGDGDARGSHIFYR
jgi:hypothetical protein